MSNYSAFMRHDSLCVTYMLIFSAGFFTLWRREIRMKEAIMDPQREVRNRLLNGWQLSKLYTFEVAARHQSFALAADELSLSPSAVSHRINQLEEELGIQLFVRSHRKVELTHEGKRVFWALKSSLDTLNQEILDIKNQELSGRSPSTRGPLSPSAGWFRRSVTLPAATRPFH